MKRPCANFAVAFFARAFFGTAFFVLSLGSAVAEDVTFWVEPCSIVTSLACAPEDVDLARWAFAAWQSASDGKLRLTESKNRETALIRLRWAPKNGGLYGETVPIAVQGRAGSEIYVLAESTDSATAKSDRLLRDAIVYLTCLHESGHALGLAHTREFADIMYSFQYGGDIEEYFGRYRRKLMTRDDIRKNAGMSPADRTALIKSISERVLR